jgi:hypothetical protein
VKLTVITDVGFDGIKRVYHSTLKTLLTGNLRNSEIDGIPPHSEYQCQWRQIIARQQYIQCIPRSKSLRFEYRPAIILHPASVQNKSVGELLVDSTLTSISEVLHIDEYLY